MVIAALLTTLFICLCVRYLLRDDNKRYYEEPKTLAEALKETTNNIEERVPDPVILGKIEKINFDGGNLDACLQYIKSRIELIKQLDPHFYAFGSGAWAYTYRNINEAEVSALVRDSGKKLPAEFRAFLLEIGFGAGPVYGAYPEAELIIEDYCSVALDNEDKPFAGGFIVVADHGCGIESRLCLNESYYGQIWRRDSGYQNVSDNYINWYISWINGLLYIFADGEYISLRSSQF